MPFQSAYPSLWENNGEFLQLKGLNEIDNVDNHVNDIVACIRSNTRMRKVLIRGALHVEAKIDKQKICQAVFINEHIKEIQVWRWDSEFCNWVSRALRETKVESLFIFSFMAEQSELSNISQSLRVNRTLKKVSVWCGNQNASTLIEGVAKALRFRSPLETLCLFGLSLDSVTQVCEPLLNALVRNRTVRKLQLSGESDDQRNVESIGAAASRVMKENMTLEEICIVNFSLGPSTDVGPLLHLLNGRNKSFIHLSLTGFRIGAHDYTIMNDTVTTLNLRGNKMSLDGAKAIGGAFSRVTALRCLNFSRCGLDDTMLAHICKVIEDSGSVDSLILRENNIGDDGCLRVCEALKQNEVMRTLALDGNARITDRSAKELIKSVQVHHAITSISLENTSVNNSVKTKLQYYLDLNKGPKRLLCSRVPLPLSIWPRAFKKANSCRHVSVNGNTQLRAPDMLYYLVKQKSSFSKERGCIVDGSAVAACSAHELSFL